METATSSQPSVLNSSARSENEMISVGQTKVLACRMNGREKVVVFGAEWHVFLITRHFFFCLSRNRSINVEYDEIL